LYFQSLGNPADAHLHLHAPSHWWCSLYHVDEAWLELKFWTIGVEFWSSANVLGAWSREFSHSLVSHSFKIWCGLPSWLSWFWLECGESWNSMYKIQNKENKGKPKKTEVPSYDFHQYMVGFNTL
jgi:hypothetical protein